MQLNKYKVKKGEMFKGEIIKRWAREEGDFQEQQKLSKLIQMICLILVFEKRIL